MFVEESIAGRRHVAAAGRSHGRDGHRSVEIADDLPPGRAVECMARQTTDLGEALGAPPPDRA